MIPKRVLQLLAAANVALLAICVYSFNPDFSSSNSAGGSVSDPSANSVRPGAFAPLVTDDAR